jgi:hypothetical protein
VLFVVVEKISGSRAGVAVTPGHMPVPEHGDD